MKKLFFFTFIFFVAANDLLAGKTFKGFGTKKVDTRSNKANLRNTPSKIDPFAEGKKNNGGVKTQKETDHSIGQIKTVITYSTLISGVMLTILASVNMSISPEKNHPYDRAVIASGLSLTAAATLKLLYTK